MVPGGRPLISVRYNYNVWKVLFFIVTDNIRSTSSGIPYLSNCPDQLSNVYICPFASTLVMYKFIGYVNEVDSHNKSRQSDLVLEKF